MDYLNNTFFLISVINYSPTTLPYSLDSFLEDYYFETSILDSFIKKIIKF